MKDGTGAELCLLKHIIDDGDAVALRKLKRDMFKMSDRAVKLYDFMKQHHDRYDKLPAEHTVKVKTAPRTFQTPGF